MEKYPQLLVTDDGLLNLTALEAKVANGLQNRSIRHIRMLLAEIKLMLAKPGYEPVCSTDCICLIEDIQSAIRAGLDQGT